MNQRYSITAAYYLAFILLGLTIAAEGATLLQLAENTNSALDQISLIFFYGSLGYLVGSYVSGKIYDRVPGHKYMTVVFAVLAPGIALVPLVTDLWALLVIVLILGMAKGALDVGCNTLLLWVHREKAGPFINGLHASFGLGAFAAPLIVEVIVKATGDIHWVYWSAALMAIPLGIWILLSPSPVARVTPELHKNAPFPIAPLALMVLCFAFYVGAEAGYGNFIKTYTVIVKLGDESQANFLNSAFWGFFTLGRLFGIWESARLRALPLLYIHLAGCLASALIVLIFPESSIMLWIGTILLGIFLAPIFPALLALSDERMHVTGSMAGWFLVGGSIGGMLIPWGIGQAVVQFGAGAMTGIILACLLANLITLAVFIKIPIRTNYEL
ncbi:MAG: MFS transporter [Chloroflexota bacterium]